jgi:hypothetical protein
MKRRSFLKQAVLAAAGMASLSNKPLATEVNGGSTGKAPVGLDAALAKDWLSSWEKNILSYARNRYCDRELGEEVGWLVSPFLNGFYYAIDVEGIVAAFEHGLVFTRADLQRLIATNRDFMWNQQFKGAKFQRIDGGEPDARWKDSPGALWTALVPHDETLRKVFLENHHPASWGGLAVTPWFLAREAAGSSSQL